MKSKPALARAAVIFSVLLILTVSGCGKVQKSALRGTVKGSGSTTLLPVVQEAATQFTDLNPATKVDIQGGGSSVGITQLEQGVVDIGNSSRDLNPGEGGGKLVDHKVAFDIIALVVNPSMPIRNLSDAQVRGIFLGDITNWKRVGGPDKEIVVVIRDQASGTREMFDKKALGQTSTGPPIQCIPSAIESGSNGVVREIVATTQNAIGYISFGYVNNRLKTISFDGVSPSKESATSGKYPMARYLHIFTKGRPKPVVQAFIDFVLSDKFQREIVATEYIPVKDVKPQ
ncbi:MAG TPA: phosphate ABC transporter substrate-binding protein [Candidatus Anoxymicrobiaceae bacterium]